jgi:anthranilate/para-aminobenzoate synthase component I
MKLIVEDHPDVSTPEVPAIQIGSPIRNETGVCFSAESIFFDRYRYSFEDLNTSIPEDNPGPPGKIVMLPESGMYFDDLKGNLYFIRSSEFSKAQTKHLEHLMYLLSYKSDQPAVEMFKKMITQELSERNEFAA